MTLALSTARVFLAQVKNATTTFFRFSAGSVVPVFDNAFWDPVLLHPGEFSTSVLGSTEVVIDQPEGVPRFGTIEVANGDAALDSAIQDFSAPGHELRVYDGTDAATFGGFTERLRAVIRSQEGTLDSVRFILADRFRGFDVPLLDDLYTGMGGLSGGGDLEGHGKPVLLGFMSNLEPVLVDLNGNSPIYQVHHASTLEILVFDNQVQLGNAGNVGNIYAASPAAGTYVTDLSQGLFRLGAPPVGRITCDAATTPNVAIDLLQEVAEVYGGLTYPTDFDTTRFVSLQARNFVIGKYYPDGAAVTIKQVLNDICKSVLCFWAFTPLGQFTAQAFAWGNGFHSGPPIQDSDILECRELPSPGTYWRIRLAYGESYVTQTLDEIGTLAPQDRKAYAAQKYRYVALANPNLLDECPAAQPLEWTTALYFKFQAQIIINELQTVIGRQTRLYELLLMGHQFLHRIGDAPAVSLSRLGIAGTADVNAPQILSITENLLEETTRVVLWFPRGNAAALVLDFFRIMDQSGDTWYWWIVSDLAPSPTLDPAHAAGAPVTTPNVIATEILVQAGAFDPSAFSSDFQVAMTSAYLILQSPNLATWYVYPDNTTGAPTVTATRPTAGVGYPGTPCLRVAGAAGQYGYSVTDAGVLQIILCTGPVLFDTFEYVRILDQAGATWYWWISAGRNPAWSQTAPVISGHTAEEIALAGGPVSWLELDSPDATTWYVYPGPSGVPVIADAPPANGTGWDGAVPLDVPGSASQYAWAVTNGGNLDIEGA